MHKWTFAFVLLNLSNLADLAHLAHSAAPRCSPIGQICQVLAADSNRNDTESPTSSASTCCDEDASCVLLDGYDDLRCFRGIPTNVIPRPDPPNFRGDNQTDARKEQKLQQQQRLHTKIQHLQTKIHANQTKIHTNQTKIQHLHTKIHTNQTKIQTPISLNPNVPEDQAKHGSKPHPLHQHEKLAVSKQELQMHLLNLKSAPPNATEHIYELHHDEYDEHQNATLAEFIQIQHELEQQEALEKQQQGLNWTAFDSHSAHHAFPVEDDDDDERGYFVQDDDLNRNSRDEDDDCIPERHRCLRDRGHCCPGTSCQFIFRGFVCKRS